MFVTSLPLLLLNARANVTPGLGWASGVGLAVWGLGFYFEALADYQKWQFRQDPANKGKFISTGLWECVPLFLSCCSLGKDKRSQGA